jgi:hypothetical protein
MKEKENGKIADRPIMNKIYSLFLLIILLSGCTATGTSQPMTETRPAHTATVTETPAPVETIVLPTLAPNPTATLDSRLPADQWQEWPVIPQVTGRAIEIYRSGLTMNLDQNAFSKVGDCQSVKAAFMGYFDLGQYPKTLATLYPNLQETIELFKGHFDSDGQAVRGGFNAASVLSPLWADPQACQAGENPLECELRLTRPIIVIVRMEIWWDGRTTEQYEKLMRKILDTIIAHGAVPILATKADNVEGNNSLNLTTAKLASEYDLPLWNFWAAVQSMPAHGMETKPPHNDGFHISLDAWSVQSFTALQALDSIWRGLTAAGANAAAYTPTAGKTPTEGELLVTASSPAEATQTATPGPTPVGGSQRIIFGTATRQDGYYDYKGIYLLDPATRQTRQVFGEGVHFHSASQDGKYLLISQGSSLYRANVDGANLIHLADGLYAEADTAAVWLPDGRVAALLTKADGGQGISILSADGAILATLPEGSALPIDLYGAADDKHIYWEAGSCNAASGCKRLGAWVSSMDGRTNQLMAGITNPLLSPDGTRLASTFMVSSLESDLGLANIDGGSLEQVSVPGKMLTSYAWSPNGKALALTLADVSDYSGLSTGNRNFVIDPDSLSISEYPASELLHPRLMWSPDGKYLFWMGTLAEGDGYKIGAELVDGTTKLVTDLSGTVGLTGSDYLLVGNAVWLPVP